MAAPLKIVRVLCLRVIDCVCCDGTDLPELESVSMGFDAFRFKKEDDASEFVLKSGCVRRR